MSKHRDRKANSENNGERKSGKEVVFKLTEGHQKAVLVNVSKRQIIRYTHQRQIKNRVSEKHYNNDTEEKQSVKEPSRRKHGNIKRDSQYAECSDNIYN
jgi:hypothetical protein